MLGAGRGTSSVRSLFRLGQCRWYGERQPQRSRRAVRVFLSDRDNNPAVRFEAGISINQVRDFLDVRGGGLKVRGDTENIVLKETADGFEGGDYVLIGFAGNPLPRTNSSAMTSHNPYPYHPPPHPFPQPNVPPPQMNPSLSQQPSMGPQHLNIGPQHLNTGPQHPNMAPQLANYPPNSLPPNYSYQQSASPSMYPQLPSSAPLPPPPSIPPNHSPLTNPLSDSYALRTQTSSPSKPPPTITPNINKPTTQLTSSQASLATELGMDKEELEMFPWLVNHENPNPITYS